MAKPRRRPVLPGDIEGLDYFDALMPLLARLKEIGTNRDRAGNRQLFYDQYVCLVLLYFFSPTITSLRRPAAGFYPRVRSTSTGHPGDVPWLF